MMLRLTCSEWRSLFGAGGEGFRPSIPSALSQAQLMCKLDHKTLSKVGLVAASVLISSNQDTRQFLRNQRK